MGSGDTKRTRHRSPAYPAVGLKDAVDRARKIYEADGQAGSPTSAALRHMGFSSNTGHAAKVLSALKKFGLIEVEGGRVRLTPRCLDVIVRPEGDDRRVRALRDAAVSPRVYADLLNRYGSALPSDASLEAELITDLSFNKNSVKGFLKDFRETLEFSRLASASDSGQEQEASGPGPSLERLPPRVEGAKTGLPLADLTIESNLHTAPPARALEVSVSDQMPTMSDSIEGTTRAETLSCRLPKGSRAEVHFSGPITQGAIDKLIAFLELEKDTYPISLD